MGGIPEILSLPSDGDPARLLALRLHALHEEDREWILGQLDPGSRGILNGLLAELRQLGFSPLPELRPEDGSVPSLPASASGEAASIGCIDAAAAGQVWQQLRDEPEAVRRCVLNAHDWRWLAELRQQQPLAATAGHRSDSGREPTARARRALLRALAGRVAAEAAPIAIRSSAVPAAAPAAGLRYRMKKVLKWRR